MKFSTHKSSWMIGLLVLAAFIVAGSSCDPDQTSQAKTIARGEIPAGATTDTAAPATVQDTLLSHVCRGEFEQAKELLLQQPESALTGPVAQLVDRYDKMCVYRADNREKAYAEQLEKLQTLRQKYPDRDIADVNDLDEVMLTVVRAREFADDRQKAEILEEPFVRSVMTQMRAGGERDLDEGKWLEAYAHCYYWLAAVYKDDKTYKEKAEELSELMQIELTLKDSSCGETAAERYEGIEEMMLLRALQLLESNYVNIIDYSGMVGEGLKRLERIGRVLDDTRETLGWSASKEAIAKWVEGVAAVKAETEQTAAAKKPSAEMVAGVLENVLALNAVTLALPKEVIIAHYTEGAFSSLDPFTNLVWPWNVKDFEKSMTQQFTGIGVEISKATGVLKVASLLPDTPAYKSGLDADDEILEVDGVATEDMTIFCAVSKITGPKGTKVVLKIRRPSTGDVRDVTITRDKIVVQPLRGWIRDADGRWDYWIDPANRIGYVRLTAFTESSGPDIDEVLKKLEKDGLNGLILDLRYNSGGYLQAAADVVDLFVSEGVIVKSNPRQGFATYEIAHRSGTHPDVPLVVLINGSSASASEIVAGALQDPRHGRATLVGERSYGKGSVQVVTPFSGGGSQLKYTVAYYHLPSDQQVKNRYQMEKIGREDWGIAPDVEVELTSNEIQGMLEIQRDNDVLFRTDHEHNGGELKRHSLEETLKADPQLSVGLIILQSKLAAGGKALAFSAMDWSHDAQASSDPNKKN